MGTPKFNNVPERKLSAVAPNLKPGDLFFGSGRYALSKAIRKGSDSLFSHVGIVFLWDAVPILLESVEDDGVRATPLRLYLEDYENTGEAYRGDLYLGTLVQPVLTAAEQRKIFERAMSLMNRKFDLDDMVKMAANLAFGVGTYERDDAYVCSEFVEECFLAAGIQFPGNKKGYVFPENIAAYPRVQAQCKLIA